MTTEHVPRLYALAGSILGFFLAWAGIAAQSSGQATSHASQRQLARYEQQLNRDAALVAKLLAARGNAAPPVRVVTLPPVTTTRSS